MKCSNCGTELSNNAKFCKQCGEKVNIKEDDIKKEGTTNKQQNNTANQVDQIKFTEKNNQEQNVIKNKVKELWKKLNVFEKICVCLSGIFILELIISLIAGKSVAMIISIIQIIGVVISFLMEKNIIKTTHKWIKITLPIICVFFVLAYIASFSSQKVIDYSNAEDIVWNEIIIGNKLPEPPNFTGYIYSNSDEKLNIEIYKVSPKQFYEYIEECKNKGFSLDSEKTEFSYLAYTEDGYKLKLSYSDYDNEMGIELNVPKKYAEIKWSEKVIAKLVPVPKSLSGEIKEDTDKTFNVIISNMTLQDYNEYILLCENSGFNVEIDKDDKRFSAKNTDSYKISVEYIGNKVIEIIIDEPEFNVSLNVECVENWIFSKYNVKIYIDDNYESTLTHGTSENYDLKLSKGTHKIKFTNADDESITGEFSTEVTQNGKIELRLNCYNYEISVESKSNSVIKEEIKQEEKNEETIEEEKKENTNNAITEGKQDDNKDSLSYSTNDYETAKKGNTGVFSYASTGYEYDVYWIIDFDNGYVYYFTDGTGETFCDRIKIEQGDLNDYVKVTWHEAGTETSWRLFFKYKNLPSILVVRDHYGSNIEFSPTNLENALKIRNTKTITDY